MEKNNITQYLCAKVGGHWLGIDVEKVVEIVSPSEKGLHKFGAEGESNSIKYQGDFIPAIHLNEYIKGDQIKYVTSARILISESENKTFGLVVDSAEEIVRVDRSGIKSPESGSPEFVSEALEGTVDVDDRKIHILSTDRIFEMTLVK